MTERRSYLARIDIDSLSIDPAIQRPLDGAWVRKIAAEFKPDSIGALVVSRRANGSVVVLDGQHRSAAGKQAGFIGKVPCLVYEGLETADEAALFLTLNNSRKVQAIDRFRVRVIEGDKPAVQMYRILRERGWDIKNAARPGCFSAVTALEHVYNGAGTRRGERDDLVRAVMVTITRAWGADYHGVHAAIVGGIGALFARFGRKVDLDRLVTTLAKHRPVHLVAKGKLEQESRHATQPAAMASVIHSEYNKGLRSSRLPNWVWTR